VLNACEVSALRHEGHGPGARHATQGLKGLDHRLQSPGFDLFLPCLHEALKPFGVRMDGAPVCLEDDVLRRGGADHVGEPPQMGRAPGRASRRADIVAEHKGVATTLGGLEIGDGIFPSPAAVTDGCVCHRRHRDGGASPCAHQAGELDRVTTVGFPAVAGLLGPQ
jgi:hypothetical protein